MIRYKANKGEKNSIINGLVASPEEKIAIKSGKNATINGFIAITNGKNATMNGNCQSKTWFDYLKV